MRLWRGILLCVAIWIEYTEQCDIDGIWHSNETDYIFCKGTFNISVDITISSDNTTKDCNDVFVTRFFFNSSNAVLCYSALVDPICSESSPSTCAKTCVARIDARLFCEELVFSNDCTTFNKTTVNSRGWDLDLRDGYNTTNRQFTFVSDCGASAMKLVLPWWAWLLIVVGFVMIVFLITVAGVFGWYLYMKKGVYSGSL